MAKKTFRIKSNLAEALGDTVSSAKNNAGELHIEIIPLRKIALDPENPRDLALTFEDLYVSIPKDDPTAQRKKSEKGSLDSLAKSIMEQGVINPIVVYKYGEEYRLIAGERRTLASIIAKKEDIPAKILTVRPDELKLSLLQWIENIEREDLTLWEKMRNLEKILAAYANKQQKQTSDVTPTEISQLVGCSLQQGVNYRHVLNASEVLRGHIQQGSIKNIEKLAVIVKAPRDLQDLLTEACLNGATLLELKRLAKEQLSKPKGRNKNAGNHKINFGFTQNPHTAKLIIDTVLANDHFQHLREKFTKVHWGEHKSVAQAFRQLVQLLEQHK